MVRISPFAATSQSNQAASSQQPTIETVTKPFANFSSSALGSASGFPKVNVQSNNTAVMSQLAERVKSWVLTATAGLKLGRKNINPELEQFEQLVDQYAESPFERELLLTAKQNQLKQGDAKNAASNELTQAWAKAITEGNDEDKEAAVQLFHDFLNYNRMDSEQKLSPHTQIKLLHFAQLLQCGQEGLNKLYSAITNLPTQQFADFLPNLSQDFDQLPTVVQLKAIKKMGVMVKATDEQSSDEQKAQWQQTLKNWVVKFYTTPAHLHEKLVQQLLSKQEKIRLGFLKFQPIMEAFNKALDETDKRYRVRLRQLKRHRTQLMTQADDDKQRRISGIYEDLETQLLASLADTDIDTAASA